MRISAFKEHLCVKDVRINEPAAFVYQYVQELQLVFLNIRLEFQAGMGCI